MLCAPLPSTRKIEHHTDDEGREARQRVTQPEAVMLHIKDKAEKNGEADAHHDAVENGGGKVDLVVGTSVHQGVHYGPQCASDEEEHRNWDKAVGKVNNALVTLGGEEPEKFGWEEAYKEREQR